MRRTILLLLSLLCSSVCLAQTTSVTATVIDSNGNPYANGTAAARVVLNEGQAPPAGAVTFTTPIGTNGSGAFSSPITVTTGLTYVFTICAPPTLTGVPTVNLTPRQVCFQSAPTLASGASMDLSTQLSLIAALLGPKGGGGSGCIPSVSINAVLFSPLGNNCGGTNFFSSTISSTPYFGSLPGASSTFPSGSQFFYLQQSPSAINGAVGFEAVGNGGGTGNPSIGIVAGPYAITPPLLQASSNGGLNTSQVTDTYLLSASSVGVCKMSAGVNPLLSVFTAPGISCGNNNVTNTSFYGWNGISLSLRASPGVALTSQANIWVDSTSNLLSCELSSGSSCMPSGGGAPGIPLNSVQINLAGALAGTNFYYSNSGGNFLGSVPGTSGTYNPNLDFHATYVDGSSFTHTSSLNLHSGIPAMLLQNLDASSNILSEAQCEPGVSPTPDCLVNQSSSHEDMWVGYRNQTTPSGNFLNLWDRGISDTGIKVSLYSVDTLGNVHLPSGGVYDSSGSRGGSGACFTSTGTATLWLTCTGTPASPSLSLQYNNAGVFGAVGPPSSGAETWIASYAGSGVAPSLKKFGIVGRTVTTTDTISSLDRGGTISANDASAFTETIPAVGSTDANGTFDQNFAVKYMDINSGTVTFSSSSTINGQTSATEGQTCMIVSLDNSTWTITCGWSSITWGSGITPTPSPYGVSVTASGGGGGSTFLAEKDPDASSTTGTGSDQAAFTVTTTLGTGGSSGSCLRITGKVNSPSGTGTVNGYVEAGGTQLINFYNAAANTQYAVITVTICNKNGVQNAQWMEVLYGAVNGIASGGSSGHIDQATSSINLASSTVIGIYINAPNTATWQGMGFVAEKF